jgi:hypothetical protein
VSCDKQSLSQLTKGRTQMTLWLERIIFWTLATLLLSSTIAIAIYDFTEAFK